MRWSITFRIEILFIYASMFFIFPFLFLILLFMGHVFLPSFMNCYSCSYRKMDCYVQKNWNETAFDFENTKPGYPVQEKSSDYVDWKSTIMFLIKKTEHYIVASSVENLLCIFLSLSGMPLFVDRNAWSNTSESFAFTLIWQFVFCSCRTFLWLCLWFWLDFFLQPCHWGKVSGLLFF